jgi:hypothetical protein
MSMTPAQLVAAASPKIGAMGGAFYFDAPTLAAGKEQGLDGFRFYVLGRGGVLGDVHSRVVTSAFGYFHPAVIARMWDSGRAKMAPAAAGEAYIECARAFGRTHFNGIEELDGFCAAAEAVNTAADPAALALYAGVSSLPMPDDLPGRAMQLVTVLRELRGSAHLLAVIASGLRPATAHAIRRPNDVALFGWEAEPPDVTDADRMLMPQADALTDRLLLPFYSVLDDASGATMLRVLEAMEQRLAARA